MHGHMKIRKYLSFIDLKKSAEDIIVTKTVELISNANSKKKHFRS